MRIKKFIHIGIITIINNIRWEEILSFVIKYAIGYANIRVITVAAAAQITEIAKAFLYCQIPERLASVKVPEESVRAKYTIIISGTTINIADQTI